MIDFTLEAYKSYLQAIRSKFHHVIRFDEYFMAAPPPSRFCIVKHDVDRNPAHALRMAILEHGLGVKSSYYFRAKRHTFIPETIREIYALGHEIGYHYECLADEDGHLEKALVAFEVNLAKFREIVPVSTSAFHGSPLSRHFNGDLFRLESSRQFAKKKMGILGDAFCDVDYSDIVYITDTGRNWRSDKSNFRDKVSSESNREFRDGGELLAYFQNNPDPKVVFQIHPERWSHNSLDWVLQVAKDASVNCLKRVIFVLRS